jgi:ABC-2 type transport system permease protein
MSTAVAIARREMRSFFDSPVAYIVLGAFLVASGGIFFFANLFLGGQASLRGFFGLAPALFVFFVPAITMRLFAEERKSGTLELLLTMPLEDWEAVLGKFLGALGMVAVGLLCTVPYAISVATLVAKGASLDWGPVVGGYLGLLLLAASFLALGLLASALSPNQIVGFIVGFFICGALYLIDKLAILFPESIQRALQFLSVDYHFGNIARGVADSRDIIFYLSLTVVGLLLTTRALAAARK